ncbi:MAG: uracil-DNA glycosylase [Clostridia bacterium]|nr:uracil-DNA glycosylase [Clostridia bacterium]
MQKRDLLDKLYSEYQIEFKGEEIVLGEGNADTKILLIGEAPGKDEVKLSRPFVGMAGKNLNEFLDILGLDRQSIYITNAIKYRLSKINQDTGRIINRPATTEEIKRNIPYLHREISIIKPETVITLGNVPLKAVTEDNGISIGAVHGAIQRLSLLENEYKLYPLYHPASVIYNQSLKETYIEDIKRLKDLGIV